MHTPRRLHFMGSTPAARALRLALPALAVVAGAVALLGTTPNVQAADPVPQIAPGSLTPVTLGELIFNDTSLSASGTQACASCHVKTRGLADPAGTFMPMGGANLDKQGHRSSMSLAYQAFNPPFTLNNGGARGGYFWDGRANTLELQAPGPLLNPIEMANTSPAAVALKLQAAPYWNELVRLYFTGSRATSARFSPLGAAANALAAYQRGDVDYALFNSKFDRVQDGSATFTAAEARGLNIFNGPRGNCASCHTSAPGPVGQRPLFTNNTYHALGLPRNLAIQANADANFYDLGLCGPDRSDLAARADLCGMFRVPTLRNVAVTGPYFHNGAVATLTDAVTFYATRDTDPRRWYPLVNGVPDKFNDMPVAYRDNVAQTPPFGLPAGAPPRLTPQDVADLVAFLNTLTDDTSAPRGGPLVLRTQAAR